MGLDIRKKSDLTWLHIDSILGQFILSKFYFSEDNNTFQIVELGQSKRKPYLVTEVTLYDDVNSGSAETFIDIIDLSLRLEGLGYPAFDYTGMMPSPIIGGMTDKGNFNPITGVPALLDISGTIGQVYKVSASSDYDFGSGIISLKQNDFIEHNGSAWQLFVNNNQSTTGDTLQRDRFTWTTGAQAFTLTENPVNIVFVAVNGQVLDTSQYNLVTNTITILDILDVNDNVIVVYNYNSLSTGINPDFIVFVDSLNKLPTPVATVITPLAGYTYIQTTDIDLLGARIDATDNVCNYYGTSSETCSLTSTGLGAGIPLITSNTTIKLRDITIKDVDTAFDLDKLTVMALDWEGVNIVNVPNIGIVKDFDNFIFTKGTFLNSKGISFDGAFDTIAFSDSLLSGDGLAGDIISIPSTAIVSRRFRIDKCAVVATGSTIGINVSTSASIQPERYILDTVAFSGGGTYTSGVLYSDNKALFKNNVGVPDSNEICLYSMSANTAPTVIVAINTPVKIAGTTTNSLVTQRFTHTNNRATYIGSTTRVFEVRVTLTLTSGNNNQVGCYVAKNGVEINDSEMYITTNGTGKAENVTVQTLVSMSNGDYLEMFAENNSSINDIIVSELNVIIK